MLAVLTVGMASASDNTTDSAPNIEVPEKIWKYGNNSITVDTEEPANIDISGSITYNSTVNPGKTSIPIENLSTGRHSIHVNSTNIQKEYNITVMKENPDWNMDFYCLDEGENLYGTYVDHEAIDAAFVVLNPPEGLTGNFTLYVNGEIYSMWNAQDKDPIYYGEYIEPKAYNFTLEYSGDDYFHPAIKTKITEYTTTLIHIPENVVNGYDDTITIISEFDFINANVTIKVNNETVYKKNKLNSDYYHNLEYRLSNLEVNQTYDIEVEFKSDYIEKTQRATVNVKDRGEDYVTFYGGYQYAQDPFIFPYGGEDNMLYFSSPKLKLNVSIDGKKVNSIYEYEEYKVDVSDLTPGKHIIAVSYDGDEKYARKTFTHDFEVVVKAELPYEIKQDDICNFTVKLPEDAKGNLSVDFINLENGKFSSSQTVEVKNSMATVTLPTAHVGNHMYKAYFKGNYELNEIAGKYFINDVSTWQIKEDDWPVYLNENRILTLAIPKDGKGTLTVRIEKDGKSYLNSTAEVINGTCDIKLPTEHIGQYTTSISFEGNYELVNYKNTYDVESEYSIEELVEYEMYNYNQEYDIILELPKDGNGTLTLEVKYDKNDNYTTYKKVMLSEGIAKIPFPTNRIGTVYYNVLYEGNYELYNLTDKSIIISPDYTYKNHIFTFTGPDDLNGTVYITTWDNDDELTADMVNGRASIDITDYLKQQNEYINFNLAFTPDKNVFYDIGYEFDVYPIYDVKIVASGVTSYYGISKSFSAKIYRNGKLVGSGQKVTIKIGSKTYSVKTNKKGVATFKITQLPGKYTMKITYKGKSVSRQLIVKQTLTLKKVTVKKSAKKLVLTATFKKGKTPVKGKKITFKFKGKKYTAKTNKKGVAKVTIKKSVLKKLKVGKKITYTATYSKNTVKKTVKVKR